MKAASTSPELIHFDADPLVPNSPLPLLLYRKEFDDAGEKGAEWLEKTFAANGWKNLWRDSVYSFHHYHTNTHEVLGVYQGSALLQLGGGSGRKVEVEAGDVIVIPAGVAHKNLGARDGFAVVGAYPDGAEPDLLREDADTAEEAAGRIVRVPIPEADPVRGPAKGLVEIWKQAAASEA